MHRTLVNNGKKYQPQLVQEFWTINSRTFFLGGILHGREHFARTVDLWEATLTPKRALSSWCVWWWDILRYLCADAILIFAGEVKQKFQNKRALMEHRPVSPLFLAEVLVAQSACFSFSRRWKNASPMHSSQGIFTPVNKKIIPWFFEPRDRWWLRWWKKPNLPLLCWLCWRFALQKESAFWTLCSLLEDILPEAIVEGENTRGCSMCDLRGCKPDNGLKMWALDLNRDFFF